jgi:hypothetical protein
MGYCVEIELHDVIILKAKKEAALKGLNAMWDQSGKPAHNCSGGSYASGGKVDSWYGWTENPPTGGFPTLEKLFDAWRYQGTEDKEGNFVIDSFNGEKWGDDDILYKAMAPYIKSGAKIFCTGEDHERWMYLFKKGTMTSKTAKVVWE